MTAEISSLRIVLAHGVDDARTMLYQALTKLEYHQIRSCGSARELKALVAEDPPDLIITGVDLPDQDGIAALLEISDSQKIPAVVVTQQRTLDIVQRALEDHVMAYLLEPVKTEEILPTIFLVLRRFEQFQELQAENESLKQALADRKIIERAKGAMMKLTNLDEETAYKRLRRYATDNRMKLIEAAGRVIDILTLLEVSEPEISPAPTPRLT